MPIRFASQLFELCQCVAQICKQTPDILMSPVHTSSKSSLSAFLHFGLIRSQVIFVSFFPFREDSVAMTSPIYPCMLGGGQACNLNLCQEPNEGADFSFYWHETCPAQSPPLLKPHWEILGFCISRSICFTDLVFRTSPTKITSARLRSNVMHDPWEQAHSFHHPNLVIFKIVTLGTAGVSLSLISGTE